MESSALNQSPARFEGEGDNQIERVRYNDNKQRVYINKEQYFSGVEPQVYEFQIGGYKPLEKWLKDRGPRKGREGRKLTWDDISHYCKIVVALKETMRLMGEIDEAIPEWPIS